MSKKIKSETGVHNNAQKGERTVTYWHLWLTFTADRDEWWVTLGQVAYLEVGHGGHAPPHSGQVKEKKR